MASWPVAKLQSQPQPAECFSSIASADDFGLPQEFGTYGKISGLSGGQKVKLVLAAAVWNCPHLLILDEPTNFLDKESLGAFASALQGFGGGIAGLRGRTVFVQSCEYPGAPPQAHRGDAML